MYFFTVKHMVVPCYPYHHCTFYDKAFLLTVDPARCSAQCSTNKKYIYIHCFSNYGGKQKYNKKYFNQDPVPRPKFLVWKILPHLLILIKQVVIFLKTI